MGFQGEVWTVRGVADGTARPPEGAGRGADAGEVIGEILIDDADFPWLSGTFTPGPGFDAVRDLFARELALAQGAEERWEEWEKVYAEIERQVSLSSPDGPVPEFLLHIDGGKAWFRWSDEPFGDGEEE
ncbi:hypothetical protein [Streptomyces griseoviridis]|uniref:hypothetical protein n=1 Tax=Streptomyces griseoviridis TaxID=45398 RepID=UPI0034152D65